MSKNKDYSFSERLLHRIALRSRAVLKTSFEVEKSLNGGDLPVQLPKAVFITGLARAGTTILLNNLYGTKVFTSLTYRNMPFVMMPKTWQRVSASLVREAEQKERAHGDKVLVSVDSPEAFEEVFWRAFDAGDYINSDSLVAYKSKVESLEEFRHFVKLIVSSGDNGPVYLSKNNNNILRLEAIKRAFPESLILVCFRDPVHHAASLLRQHLLFSEMHENDSFSLEYMNLLGHFEFGQNQKPFIFNKNALDEISQYEKTNINYWLSLWCHVYQSLLKQSGDYQFLCHEQFREEPVKHIEAILNKVSPQSAQPILSVPINRQSEKVAPEVDPILLNTARETYSELSTLARQGF